MPVVDCGSLAVVANGNHNFTGTKFGYTASYECMDGYKLVGVAERVCQENGTWSGEAPSCQTITPSPTAVGKSLQSSCLCITLMVLCVLSEHNIIKCACVRPCMQMEWCYNYITTCHVFCAAVTMTTSSAIELSAEAPLTTTINGVQSSTAIGIVPTPTPTPTPTESGPRTSIKDRFDPFIVVIGLSAGGGALLLLAVLCCVCTVCAACRRCVRKRNRAPTLDRTSQTSSVRRPSLMERKTSLFMDDTDYVIRTGTVEDVRASQATLRGRVESISEENLDVPLERFEDIVEETPDGLEEAELAEPTHRKDYTMTGFSSPSTSEVEMQSSKVLPNIPTHATPSNRFSYASQGPSSTPQHYRSNSLTSSSDKLTTQMEADHQGSPPLPRQQGPGWPLLLADRAASNISIHLGGDIQFDSERFEQCMSAGPPYLSESSYQIPQPASGNTYDAPRTSSAPYNYAAHGYMRPDDMGSVEDEQVSKLSLASSLVAVQGDSVGSDPRSYTPSSAVSSSMGGGYYQRIADDASESDVESHQQYHTPDQPTEACSPPHMLRRIHSDVHMQRPPFELGVAASPSLKHTTSAGPDRFEGMKRKGEKRKSYKDFHGYPSINEWFEDIWVANTDSQQQGEEGAKPKGRPTALL